MPKHTVEVTVVFDFEGALVDTEAVADDVEFAVQQCVDSIGLRSTDDGETFFCSFEVSNGDIVWQEEEE